MGAREASECPSGSVGHPPLFEVEAGHVLIDGMVVSEVISTITRANEQSNQKYLEAKQDRVKRLLSLRRVTRSGMRLSYPTDSRASTLPNSSRFSFAGKFRPPCKILSSLSY
jgi:hypothetical protein